jgi:hypothetical protein
VPGVIGVALAQSSLGAALLGRCHVWIARTQLAQDRFEDANQSLTQAIELMTGNVPEGEWSLSLAHLLHHVIAVRNGEPEHAGDAVAAYQRLLKASPDMFPEDRNTILPEARHYLQAAQIDVGQITD